MYTFSEPTTIFSEYITHNGELSFLICRQTKIYIMQSSSKISKLTHQNVKLTNTTFNPENKNKDRKKYYET